MKISKYLFVLHIFISIVTYAQQTSTNILEVTNPNEANEIDTKDTVIFYDVIYEKELTEEEKASSSFIKDITVTFNKNKLVERVFRNTTRYESYTVFDYSLKKYYKCNVTRSQKRAIVSNFRTPSKDVEKQNNSEKTILDLPCDEYVTIIAGKPVKMYATKAFGLRFAHHYKMDGFLLDYYAYNKKLGKYRVVAKKIEHLNIPTSYYSLNGFDVMNKEAYKKLRSESRKNYEERKSKYNKIADKLIDKKKPVYSTKTIINKKISSKKMLGKVVVLNFWYTTCPPCKKEIPLLNKLKHKYKNKDVEFIAFALDEEYKLANFLLKNRFDYDMVSDARWLKEKFQIQAYPTNIIIDKKGKIQFYDVGYKSTILDKMSYKIDQLLAQKI